MFIKMLISFQVRASQKFAI